MRGTSSTSSTSPRFRPWPGIREKASKNRRSVARLGFPNRGTGWQRRAVGHASFTHPPGKQAEANASDGRLDHGAKLIEGRPPANSTRPLQVRPPCITPPQRAVQSHSAIGIAVQVLCDFCAAFVHGVRELHTTIRCRNRFYSVARVNAIVAQQVAEMNWDCG